jgi:hypothetical protein
MHLYEPATNIEQFTPVAFLRESPNSAPNACPACTAHSRRRDEAQSVLPRSTLAIRTSV